MNPAQSHQLVLVRTDAVELEAMLELPPQPCGIVIFAHGSGSSRHSVRNNYVAGELRRAGLATLLMDLLTQEEDRYYETRFNIALLSRRLTAAVDWSARHDSIRRLPIGLFGASTGAAAALQAAVARAEQVGAVVSRGGRPDMAGAESLRAVSVPTLLIVGGLDTVVITLNRDAYALLNCEKQLEIVPGATHLFEEPGTLEAVARLASAWFSRHLQARPTAC